MPWLCGEAILKKSLFFLFCHFSALLKCHWLIWVSSLKSHSPAGRIYSPLATRRLLMKRLLLIITLIFFIIFFFIIFAETLDFLNWKCPSQCFRFVFICCDLFWVYQINVKKWIKHAFYFQDSISWNYALFLAKSYCFFRSDQRVQWIEMRRNNRSHNISVLSFTRHTFKLVQLKSWYDPLYPLKSASNINF